MDRIRSIENNSLFSRQFQEPLRRLWKAVALLLLWTSSCTMAWASDPGQSGLLLSNPYQRGPAPTTAALNAATGPFAIRSLSLSGAGTPGFGSSTVYYPADSSQGQFGLVVLCPGITATKGLYTWLATRVASWGFVVINMNANTTLDFDGARERELEAALSTVATLSQTRSSPLYGRIDVQRRAVIGHSMGGGAALDAGLRDSDLLASVALAPGGVATSASVLTPTRVPTLIVGFDLDTICPPAIFADVYYAELPATLDSAKLLMQGNHLTPTTIGVPGEHDLIATMTVSWLKRFVDDDTRFDSFVQNAGSPLAISYRTQGPDL
jgi:hypothetical protein